MRVFDRYPAVLASSFRPSRKLRRPMSAGALIVLSLSASVQLQATAYTSIMDGNWSSGATWSGGGFPGIGDTATISNNVTVDINIIVGASNGQWVSGTNPAAIQTNGLGSVTVAPGFSLTIRGDFVVNNTAVTAGNALIAGAGSAFYFDSSTSSPTSTIYRFMPIGDSIRFAAPLFVGTSGAHAIIGSVPGGANGQFYNNGHYYSLGAYLTWTDVSNLGGPSYNAMEYCPGYNQFEFSHVTFTASGPLESVSLVNIAANLTISFQNVFFINSLGTTNLIGFNFAVLPTSGAYSFQNVVFDKQYCNTCYTAGVTFDTIYFGDTSNLTLSAYPWASFTNVVHETISVGSDIAMNGDVTGAIFLAGYPSSVSANVHSFLYSPGSSQNLTDIIFQGVYSPVGHGAIFDADSGSAAFRYLMRGLLVLRNGAGLGTVTAVGINATTTNLSIDIKNSTVANGSAGAGTAGLLTYGETGNSAAGTITRLKDSIVWDTSVRSAIVQDSGHLNSGIGIITDVVAPANADYNDGWNFTATYTASGNAWFTNQGKGYQAAYSSTPGSHDLAVDPQFVDATRGVPTFDSAYLRNTAPAWSSFLAGHTFAVGDVASDTNIFAGIVINWRCIASHVKSTANSEPGVGSASQTYWELATLYDIRTAMQAGTTYTDPVLGLVAADPILTLRTWIKYGFRPTNPLLATAGSDGGVIGAEPFQAATTAAPLGNSSIAGLPGGSGRQPRARSTNPAVRSNP